MMDHQQNQQIVEKFKCFNCFGLMYNQIYDCNEGHSICDSCSEDVIFCPICNSKLNNNRNFTLEAVRDLVKLPCDNKRRGCRKTISFDEHQYHVESCDYRLYNCQLGQTCFWRGRREDIKKHCFDHHQNNILVGPNNNCFWKIQDEESDVKLILAYGEKFYLHRTLKDGIMYWFVQYIGKTEDIILYYFTIVIETDQFPNRKLAFSEICLDDVKENVEECIENGFFVAIPIKLLETYICPNNAVFYTIKIEQS